MKTNLVVLAATALVPFIADARDTQPGSGDQVSVQVIEQQRKNLARNVEAKGYGPQSPRDIDSLVGDNPVIFSAAPESVKMNLCNIHFHKHAEHKGGEFTDYVGPGDGEGYYTGFKYSGELSNAERASVSQQICPSPQGSLAPGDTIEAHYVYSSADIKPGPGLTSCFNEAITNPQLRVEAQVYVLVNNDDARDFGELTAVGQEKGYHQALNIPDDSGTPVQYRGSTTGPAYNEEGSPFQVTWNVRPEVVKVDIESVGKWCEGNVFNEDHAHGSRNLIVNPDLLSQIDTDDR